MLLVLFLILVNSHQGINPVMTVIWRHQCMHLPLDEEEKGLPQFSRLFRYGYPVVLLQNSYTHVW